MLKYWAILLVLLFAGNALAGHNVHHGNYHRHIRYYHYAPRPVVVYTPPMTVVRPEPVPVYYVPYPVVVYPSYTPMATFSFSF